MTSSSSSTPSPPPSAPLPIPASPPKRPAPLPWSHPETLALIEAYQEKWYSVNRGPLKSSQWEEIAVTVAARCGFDDPSRTSTQCRHKIEKLRKRYRADLRSPCPNPWQYFDLMDRLERGPLPLTARPMPIVKSPSPNFINHSSFDNVDVNVCSSRGFYYDESDEDWSEKNNNKSRNVGSNVNLRGRNNAFRNATNGKRKVYDDDDEEEEEEEEEEGDDVEEEEEEGGGEREIAAEIRGFAERYMRMESWKIEMMRETERCRMEMERKKMEMIRESHGKIISSIGSAFGAHKKGKMGQES